jgi:glycyl-tRNA synthetase beta chain
LEKLDRVSVQKGLGSMGDKTRRVMALSDWACSQILQHRPVDGPSVTMTAKLAYTDLVTDVIGEFPELQGAMGGVYARAEELDERVALGLEEFYYPVGANAALPSMLEGCLVSFSGKLDTIAAMFSAGFTPSGSEDPFGLRRLGNGVIRILLEKQIPISITQAVQKAVDTVTEIPGERDFDRDKVRADVEEFLWQRLESLFLEKGFKNDEVRSVRDGGLERLPETFRRISAVHQLRPEADFVELAAAFKRASNILKKSEVPSDADVDKDLFKEKAETELFRALCRVEGDVREKVSQGMYEEGLRSLVGLKPQVDQFFDDVMVMAKEEEIKTNRLSLLGRLVRLFKSVADISHIQN